MSVAGKALVLAPSHEEARTLADHCNPASWPVLSTDDVATGVGPFAEKPNALLALAGRYDGIDLPGDSCRLVLLAGLPDSAHLQERFLAVRVRANGALEERIRTRVVQGAGRCTRGPSDHAIVMLIDSGLARYLSHPQRRTALDPDIQAEVEFGLQNSRGVASEELVEAAEVFFAQDDQWRAEAEPMLVQARREMVQSVVDGTDKLAAAAGHEVAACQQAWRTGYASASAAAQEAAQALSGVAALQTYRGFWTYLAAVWALQAGESDPTALTLGQALLQRANDASRATTWLTESDPGHHAVTAGADDAPAVRRIAERLERGTQRSKVEKQLQRARDGLAEVTASRYEAGLAELGDLLGAEASKPTGQAQCDSAWCWGERIWLALEAKSEHSPDGEIAVRDVRQAGSQLRSLAALRGVEVPETHASIMISPRVSIHPDAAAAAESHVYLLAPTTLTDLLTDVTLAWEALLAQHPGHTGVGLQQLVRRTMGDYRVLPTQVFERLTDVAAAG